MAAIDGKIACIQCHNHAIGKAFRHDDKTRICQVHWTICILLHQLAYAIQRIGCREVKYDRSVTNQVNHGALAIAVICEARARLSQNGFTRYKTWETTELLHRPI